MLRAHRFTDPPTKANRFLWAGAWIRHRRPVTPFAPAYRRFAAAGFICARQTPPQSPDPETKTTP